MNASTLLRRAAGLLLPLIAIAAGVGVSWYLLATAPEQERHATPTRRLRVLKHQETGAFTAPDASGVAPEQRSQHTVDDGVTRRDRPDHAALGDTQLEQIHARRQRRLPALGQLTDGEDRPRERRVDRGVASGR